MMAAGLVKAGERFAVVLAIVGLVVYGALIFLPRRTHISDVRNHIADKRLSVAQSGATVAEIARISEELAEAKPVVAEWFTSAPAQDGPTAVFREITQLAKSTGIRNLRLEPAPVEHLVVLWRSPLELTAEGTFLQLFEFLRGLEAISPCVQTASLRIESIREESRILRMSVTLTVFAPKSEFSDYVDLAE